VLWIFIKDFLFFGHGTYPPLNARSPHSPDRDHEGFLFVVLVYRCYTLFSCLLFCMCLCLLSFSIYSITFWSVYIFLWIVVDCNLFLIHINGVCFIENNTLLFYHFVWIVLLMLVCFSWCWSCIEFYFYQMVIVF